MRDADSRYPAQGTRGLVSDAPGRANEADASL